MGIRATAPRISEQEDRRILFHLDRETRAGDGGLTDAGLKQQQPLAHQTRVRNVALYAGQQRRMQESRALLEIASIVNSTLDLQVVLDLIMDTAVELLWAEAGSLVLVDQDTDELVFEVTAGPGSADLVGTRLPLDTGIIGAVVQRCAPIIIGKAQTDRRWYQGVDDRTQFVTQSIIAVPMISRGSAIGVIELLNRRDGLSFDRDDEQLLIAFAANAAVAIANARLYEEAKRRLAEVELVHEVVLAAASTLDFDLVFERAVEALHRVLGTDSIGFLLPDERTGTLVPHPSLGGCTEPFPQVPVRDNLVGRAYRTGEPVVMRDVAQEPAYTGRAPGVRSALAVPVQAGDRIIAVLHAESPRAGAFGEDELRLYTTIAGQLGVTLENARLYQEAQEINRLRTELLQNVGHELRTPLALIQGYGELLLEEDLGPILDSQRAALQVVHTRSVALTRLIRNMTVLHGIPERLLAGTAISIVEVVQQALEDSQRSADRSGILFLEDLPPGLPPAFGDREQLKLVFDHLVDNAIKFSPDGGTVALRAWAAEETVYISVVDEGIGIAPEHLDRIFERFYQVDGSATRRFGGMGLGLALVWEIVEAHGGTVSVDSDPGKGSTFTVALPQPEAKTVPDVLDLRRVPVVAGGARTTSPSPVAA